MSVLVRGMEMPESCYECKLNLRAGACHVFLEWLEVYPYAIKADGRLPGCPLIELPEKAGESVKKTEVRGLIRAEGVDTWQKKYKGKQYITLKDSLFFKHFCFFDTEDMLSDKIFEEIGLRVLRHSTRLIKDYSLVSVICKVRKGNWIKFALAMRELKNRATLCGHPKYLEETSEIIWRVLSRYENTRKEIE